MALTNKDIADLINANHTEVTKRLTAVEEQVKQTNGRVRALEKAEIGREAVAEYKAKQTEGRRFDITTFIAIIAAIAMIIGALWWLRA